MHLDLAHFFSPTSGCKPHKVPYTRLAILGNLPASTPYHLALNFARAALTEVEAGKYSQGRRNLDADAAIDLSPDTLILSPNRAEWHAGLVEENDEYLASKGGDPAVARILQRHVDIRFLQSTTQWRFFCSAVQTAPSPPQAGGQQAIKLRSTPGLVIVHNLSRLLDEAKNAGAGIETYASLVAATLAASPHAPFIVFLDNLEARYHKIPLLPAHLNTALRKRRRGEHDDDAQETQRGIFGAKLPPVGVPKPMFDANRTYASEPRSMETRRLLEYFFEAVGIVSDEGGVEDLNWYELRLEKSPRPEPHVRKGPITAYEETELSQELEVYARFAVHRVADETGFSGRPRLSVRFG